MENNKSLISLITVLLILIGILGILNMVKINNSSLQKAQIYQDQEKLEQEKESLFASPIKLSKKEVISAAISEAGKEVIFFDGSSNAILKTDYKGGGIKTLYSLNDKNINNIIWSPTKRASINFSGLGIKKYVNYTAGQQTELNKNIKAVEFSKDGRKIVYHYFEGNEGSVSVANPDGTEFKILIKTRIPEIKIQWPDDDNISFHSFAPENPASLFLLNIDNLGLNRLTDPLYQFSVLWAPNGKVFVYSGTNKQEDKIKLFLQSPENSLIDLGLNIQASNCVWSIDSVNIFCSAESGFWKINTANKNKEQVYLNGNYLGENLMLSPLENYLIFKNKRDGFLYSLLLK